MRCSSCGSLLTDDARFCAACGHPVSHIAEQRRIVTVLFADLVGFTTLAERMDPEQVKRLIEVCVERLGHDIESFGGRIDKVLGDGVLALFGAPVAHEDDPERAVRCALQMHHTLAATLEQTAFGGDLDHLQMRIGINTGEVLVGTIGAEYTAMGDVVNTAARLQGLAPPGRVLVAEATRLATTHAIDYESAGTVLPRGREHGVDAWLAIRPIAPPGARWSQLDVSLVGREHELALARSMFELVGAQQRGALLSIVADSGVGKTRLLDEFAAVFGAVFAETGGGHTLRGWCLPYGEANHWWPIGVALAHGLEVEPSDPADTLRSAVAELFEARWPGVDPPAAATAGEVLVHLCGLPSRIDQLEAATARSTIQQSIARILTAIGDGRAVLLAIDDLHWASTPVVELVNYLVGIVGRMALIVMTAHRPDTELVWPPPISHAVAITLHLDALDEAASAALVQQLIGEDSEATRTARLATAIYERSGGNPLFIQEMTALAASGESVYELPATLRTLIGARLDQLSPAQRQMLENAATLGLSGTVRGLQRFAAALRHPYSYSALLDLAERGLLEIGAGRWRFRSDSIRDATYQTMTKSARAKRHADITASLRRMSEGSDEISADDITYHAAAAAELLHELGHVDGVDPGIVEQAATLLAESAERAVNQGTLRAAVQHSTRALGLIASHPSRSAQRNRVLLVRANALLELRHFAAALADVDVVLGDLAGDAGVATEAEALRILGAIHHAEGRQDQARVALGRSVELLRGAGLTAPLARSLRSRGYIELFNGSLPEAEWFFGEADSLYVELGDAAGRAWIEQHRALAAFLSGDLATAQRRLGRVTDQMEALGDRNGVGWARGLLAFVAFYRRDFAEAAALAGQVREGAAERGDEWAAAMMLTLDAHLDLWNGQLARAGERADAARQRFRRLGDPMGLLQAASVLVRVQVARGQFDDAHGAGQELLALADTSPLGAFALVSAANASLHGGNHTTAISLAERARERMRVADIVSIEPTLVEVLAQIQGGQLDAAAQAFATVDGSDAERTALAGALLATLHDSTTAEHRGAAEERSAQAWAITTASYFERILAGMVRAAVLQRTDAAAAAAVLGQAAELAARSDDVIAAALVAGLSERLGHGGEEHAGDVPSGWLGVITALARA